MRFINQKKRSIIFYIAAESHTRFTTERDRVNVSFLASLNIARSQRYDDTYDVIFVYEIAITSSIGSYGA